MPRSMAWTPGRRGTRRRARGSTSSVFANPSRSVHARLPADGVPETGGIGVEAADVDRLLFRRPRHVPHRPGAGDVDQQRDKILVRDGLQSADVEHLPVAGVRRAGAKKRIRRIVDVDEVAHLGAVAEDLNLASFQREPDEPADEALAVVPDELPRPVDVGQPERAGADVEDVVVEKVVVFAGGLVDAVHVDRPHEMALGDRQRVGFSVHLARARQTPPSRAGLNLRHASRIDSWLRQLISRSVCGSLMLSMWLTCPARLKMTSRSRTRWFIVLSWRTSAMLTRTLSAMPSILKKFAPESGNQRVHQQHVGAELDEAPGDVAADEAEAAGNHHAPAAIEILMRRVSQHALSCAAPRGTSSAAAGDRSCGAAARRARTRASARRCPCGYTRGKLKNCDWPCARW